MKTFILTIDYELFFGSHTGTVEKCMMEPVGRLCDILDNNESKMTVFWDILHYYRLTKLAKDFTELEIDRKLIEKQISFLISKGHDVQLHIHPHWLDAKYTDGKWNFTYDRFDLHSLSELDDAENIETITGCITISKNLMENVIRKYEPEYKVTTFRAGGYLIEPFEKLKKAFEFNNIYIDSSILPGMSKVNKVNGYDFKNYPRYKHYNFEDTPLEYKKGGKFTEIPVTTLKVPVHRNVIYTLIRRLKYPELDRNRNGTGSEETAGNDNNKLKKIAKFLTKSRQLEFTTDSNFAERFQYMYRKAKNLSTMILHPKLLNDHTLDILKNKLTNNEIKFITIKNYLAGNE